MEEFGTKALRSWDIPAGVQRSAVLVLISAALFFNIKMPVRQLFAGKPVKPAASLFLEGATPLRTLLTHGPIGYITDLPPATTADDDVKLLRYALAPATVVKGAGAPIVVGRFTTLTAARKFLDEESFELVRTGGSSLFVFNKR